MDASDNRDLAAACLWATVTAIAVALSDSALLRTILGVPTVFLVPGHALLRAIGVRTGSALEHLVCAVGASLAAGIAGGFVLNVVGLLVPLGWVAWFWAVAVGASFVAIQRSDAPDLPPWPRTPPFRLQHAAAFALAASLASGAYALAIHDEAEQQEFKYTEFWMLPSVDGGRLSVGVRSAEARIQRFDIEITLDGHPLAAFRSLAMAPSDVWTQEIPVPVQAAQQKAEARLYRLEDGRLYRHVSALLPGT